MRLDPFNKELFGLTGKSARKGTGPEKWMLCFTSREKKFYKSKGGIIDEKF